MRAFIYYRKYTRHRFGEMRIITQYVYLASTLQSVDLYRIITRRVCYLTTLILNTIYIQ